MRPGEFAVIGLGRFGGAVALTLARLGHHVLGVDVDPHRAQSFAPHLTHAVQMDATEEEALRQLGMRNFDTVVVAIGGHLDASILITLLLKEMGVRRVVAKASSDLHGKILEKVGADRVVYPEKEMGQKVARFLTEANVLDLIELTPHVSLVETGVPAGMVGRNLRDLDLRARYGVTVLALRRGERVIISPSADQPLHAGDVLVLLGDNEKIAALQERMAEKRA
jgi:trk system potassium uptake protein TrkA